MTREELESINELINKVNYKQHMSEVGFTVIDDDNNEEVVFGDDAKNVLGFHADEERLIDELTR